MTIPGRVRQIPTAGRTKVNRPVAQDVLACAVFVLDGLGSTTQCSKMDPSAQSDTTTQSTTQQATPVPTAASELPETLPDTGGSPVALLPTWAILLLLLALGGGSVLTLKTR